MAAPLFLIPMATQMAYGTFQNIKANKELKKLQRTPMARYDITPEQTRSYNRAEQIANVGFTGAERNRAMQDIASSQNLAFRRAQQIGGGNAAKSITGALGASRLNAMNELAGRDAMLRRRNMAYADNVGNQLTSQRNRQTAQDIAYRMEVERNLGQAKQQGAMNVLNAISGGTYAAYGNLKPMNTTTTAANPMGGSPQDMASQMGGGDMQRQMYLNQQFSPMNPNNMYPSYDFINQFNPPVWPTPFQPEPSPMNGMQQLNLPSNQNPYQGWKR